MTYNTETERFREIAKKAESLYKALKVLAPTYRDHLQMATMEADGARGNAIRALVHLAAELDHFAAGSAVTDEDWRALTRPYV